MSNNKKYVLGMDIGASSIKFGWGDCQLGLQHFDKKELSSKTLSCLMQTVQNILDDCEQMIGLQHLSAIGIGTPGTIDLESGKILGVNPNLPYWSDHSPRELIPSHLNVPVLYDNDANLMCLAEAWLRGSMGKIIGITVGSGIGCGFVENGIVYHGAHGYAMEFGHVIHTPGGEFCTCGRQGCIEAYASVDGIRRRILQQKGLPSSSFEQLSLSKLLADRAAFPLSDKIIREGLQALALGLVNMTVLLDPDLIVIGGGAMEAGLYDMNDLEVFMREQLPRVNRRHFRLEMALEGNRAGVLGAIVLASQAESRKSE